MPLLPVRPLPPELLGFAKWRIALINMERKGVAVTQITCEQDRKNILRLLGWFVATKKLKSPTLQVFGSAKIGAAVQQFVDTFVTDKGRKWSTVANYVSSFVAAARFVRSRGAAAVGRLSSVQATVDSACQPSTRQRSVRATTWTKLHASSGGPCVGRTLRSEWSVSRNRAAVLRSETRACVILRDCAADVQMKSTCRHEHRMRVARRVMFPIGSKVLY